MIFLILCCYGKIWVFLTTMSNLNFFVLTDENKFVLTDENKYDFFLNMYMVKLIPEGYYTFSVPVTNFLHDTLFLVFFLGFFFLSFFFDNRLSKNCVWYP